VCRKSGTHGCEAEVERAIPPSTVTASPSRFGSMWRRSDDGSARCVRARRGCGSRWHSTRRTPTVAYRTPVSASPCRSRSRPTARAQPRSGGPARQRWRPASPIEYGCGARCCSIACRRGPSPRRCRAWARRRMARRRGPHGPTSRAEGLLQALSIQCERPYRSS
jgi:hypothetical protein